MSERNIPQELSYRQTYVKDTIQRSSPVASRTSGDNIVIMIVGDMISGAACNASHPAVPYV